MARTRATLRGRGGELPEEARGLRCKAPEDIKGKRNKVYDSLTASRPVTRLLRSGRRHGRMTRANVDELAC